MTALTLALASPEATLAAVGGKGASLAKLSRAGIPVPDGFFVTTAAYRQFVVANDLAGVITAALSQLDPVDTTALAAGTARIRQAFMRGTMPPTVAQAIDQAYSGLGAVAIRSSATAEDLPDASFAGQQDSYLNVQGITAVNVAIQQCWASLWTARAVAYRLTHHIDSQQVALAVVVQQLIVADASGVMFTLNPLSGRRDELTINATWGLGEALVSGVVTPDTLVVNKTTQKTVTYSRADKQVMTVRTTTGTDEQPVPATRRKKRVLLRRQIRALAQFALRIESLYEVPMDIEWVIAAGQVSIVQARPITVLPAEWRVPETDVIYTRGSLAEHLPNPVSPLFATFGMSQINKAAADLWQVMFGASATKLLPQHGAYTTINHYVYMSVNNKPALIAARSLAPRPMKRALTNSVARFEAARDRFQHALAQGPEHALTTLSAPALLAEATRVFAAACAYFTGIQQILPAASLSETLLKKLGQKVARRAGIPDLGRLLQGAETQSLQAEKRLWELAAWANEDPVWRAYLHTTPAETSAADYQGASPIGMAVKWPQWHAQLSAYFAQFGHTVYDYDFAVPTPNETLTPIFEAIKAAADRRATSPFVRQQRLLAQRADTQQRFVHALHGPTRKLLLKVLDWAQATAPMREDALFAMGMGHAQLRALFNELGRRFTQSGAIAQASDVYWLKLSEVQALINADAPTPNYATTVAQRQAAQAAAQQLTPPQQLPQKSAATKATGLQGIGTSGGVVTAKACVVSGPEDFARFEPGSVLVAVTTTPAWTPLFATAGAVVTDIGGPLSHSSIVAREYGIPAVMGTQSATKYIKDGQLVTVDGATGTITIEQKTSESEN